MIYLASPYSHSDTSVVQQRYDQVLQATAELTKREHIIFSPIVHSHPMAVAHGLPTDFNFWILYDTDFVSKADELWVLTLDGWEKSKGVCAEIDIARNLNKPFSLVSYPDLVIEPVRYRSKILGKRKVTL